MAFERSDLLHAIGVFRDLATLPVALINRGFDSIARSGVGRYTLRTTESIAFPESAVRAWLGPNELAIVGAQVTAQGIVAVRVFDTLGNPIDPVLLMVEVLQLQTGPRGTGVLPPTPPPIPGGGGDLFAFLARGDFSVNKASVDNAWSSTPVIKTQTGVNAAGGFNGGGTGNKAILGVDVGDGLALGDFLSLSYRWRPLVPYVVTPFLPYANLIVELGAPAPAGFKVLVIDPASVPALNNAATVNNGDGTFTTTFDAALNFALVVNDVPGYPPGVPLPAVDLNPVGTWVNRSYRLSDIAAAYPAAALRRANSLDGGLPLATVTPAMLVIAGDSGNNRIHAWEILAMTFNGVPC